MFGEALKVSITIYIKQNKSGKVNFPSKACTDLQITMSFFVYREKVGALQSASHSEICCVLKVKI